MSSDPIQALTQQLQAMADMAAGQVSPPAAAKTLEDGSDFQSVLRKAVLEVNAAQNSAQAKVQAFSTGESNMTLEEVMVSLQKANLSFQTMIAVRNRLVDAYKEVTNLQV